ncbi:MAG: aspartate aminotransferase family protein [Deltaproteobacteria bacterium]|nr:MAG: aspartate aminotransferase family protein [Deltaproteobacteria bacterium]
MRPLGQRLPLLRSPVPGPRSRAAIDRLARFECPAITARRARRAQALGAAHDDPIVWAEAIGANIVDADGNLFVDLCAGFGVATLGHRDPEIVQAARDQAELLLHAMGDAYPDLTRIALLEELAHAAPGGLCQAILSLSGADAIDAAVKTALLATGRTGVITFQASYHGLSLGATPLGAYKSAFVEPFRRIVHPDVRHLPFGAPSSMVRDALRTQQVGLVLVEPVQARGGCRPAPPGWLHDLREACTRTGTFLAFDEVYTGFGRTGRAFACEHEGVIPDLLCVGKSLGGGYPISACLGTEAAMAAWGASRGEALHTQTFLGHPIGCATARVTLARLPQTATACAVLGESLRRRLTDAGLTVRGKGALLGVELGAESLRISRELLQRGFLALPAGVDAEVLSLTPPACLTAAQQDAFVHALQELL